MNCTATRKIIYAHYYSYILINTINSKFICPYFITCTFRKKCIDRIRNVILKYTVVTVVNKGFYKKSQDFIWFRRPCKLFDFCDMVRSF
jgi:hypothetical protein